MSEAQRAAVRDELTAAPRGRRVATADRLAAQYGVSRSAIYAAARLHGTKRSRGHRPEYAEWTRIAVRRSHLAPEPVPLDLAVRACVAAGELPPEAAEMPLGTMRRIRRELGLVARPKRTHRLSAEWPGQVVLIDGSTSQRLSVVEQVDGDWLLKLHRVPPGVARGYKNKPLAAHRQRLQAVGLWDRCTGLSIARYHVAAGESAIGVAETLCWALAGGHPAGQPMRGVPDELWSDGGPLVRSGATRDLLERLDVDVDRGPAYAKERQGGVERPWRTQWSRFERSLYLRADDTILLSELNGRLMRYGIEEARRASRAPRPDGSRWSRAEAWRVLAGRRPTPLRELPPEPLRTLAREVRRKLDRNGILRVDGAEYECRDWHDRWVVVRLALVGGGDAVTIEDDASGERRECPRWRPRPHGEIAAVPATPLDRLLAEDAPAWPGADPYEAGDAPANVVALPPRTAPAAELADPLDADRLPSLDAAMRLFSGICPGLSARSLAAVRAEIERAGLSRAAVVELARDIAAPRGGNMDIDANEARA